MLETLFQEFHFPENTHRVYESLLENGAASASQLAKHLGIPRPSVYDHLRLLIENGLVIDRQEQGKKIFQVDDLDNLPRLVQAKIDKLKKETALAQKAIKSRVSHDTNIEPKIRFYQGAEGVKQVLNDLLWYEDIETLSMWPINEMIKILGAEYHAEFNRKRIRHNISLRGIWPYDEAIDFKEHPFLGIGKKHLRSLRRAPDPISWNIGYWLYADKVAFVSSKKESFGFVIHSKDFADFIRAQFEVMWKISTPIKPQPQHIDDFLKTV